MSRRNSILFLLFPIIISCGPRVVKQFYSTPSANRQIEKVAALHLEHKVPASADLIGEVKYGESGISFKCDFDYLIQLGSELAKEKGANIIKITEIKSPDLWSGCYRIRLKLFFYEGKINELEQIQFNY